MPLVSVALCTYNGEAYLKELLDTLVAQTYPEIEIIIVDDCSTDNTGTILKLYATQCPQIKTYTNSQNLGYAKNFEKAINLCNGDYIALCDQDDIWNLEKISLMVSNIGNHVLIYHDSAFTDHEGRPLNKKLSDLRNCYSGDDARVFLFENCVSGHAVLFKKELLNRFGNFNPNLAHDWWLAFVAANNGKIWFLNKVLVQYRQHNQANTNILRQYREGFAPDAALQKMEKQLNIVAILASYQFNEHKDFSNKLAMLLDDRMKSYTSLSLAVFVFKHRCILLYIRKKSAFSKLNFILQLAVGYQLKRLFIKND